MNTYIYITYVHLHLPKGNNYLLIVCSFKSRNNEQKNTQIKKPHKAFLGIMGA